MQLPAHCRVTAWVKPTSDSNIEVAVWLPAADWNGKFLAVGNGGWAGSVSYSAMAQSIFDGYATASTDTGHKGGDVSFAMGHPEKMIDYGWRSEHEMTVKAKAIITAFYGKRAEALLLERLLHRRQAGPDGSAEVPRRLRRHHRRCARQLSDRICMRGPSGWAWQRQKIRPTLFRRPSIRSSTKPWSLLATPSTA